MSMLRQRPRRDGFTLIELLVVLAVIALLLTLAVPRYFASIDRSKQTILVENLQTARRAIDDFYRDTGRYPLSLDELVQRRYLRTLPSDPLTERSDSWVIVPPADISKGNVYDIRSGADGVDRDGMPYSQW